MKEFIAKENLKLTKLVLKEYPELSFGQVSNALKNKDIRLDNVRTNKDVLVNVGTKVSVYIDFDKLESKIKRIYEDENVLIVFKPRGIEVVGNASDLEHVLMREGVKVFACHRIDVNTEGLVVLAKNKRAEEELLKAFKNHAVHKEYTAWVCGHMEREQDTLKAYLIKNAAASRVQVFYEEKKNSKEIITKYKVLEDLKTSSLLSVEILTGRTHQIRAHLAFIGHAVIGDDKYGNREINKAFSMKYQALTASKLKFNLTGFLSYLNNKTFKVSPTWLENLNKDRI